MLTFSQTSAEQSLITAIAKRAVKNSGFSLRHMETEMDIAATHCNGCPLDLAALLAAPDEDFNHDLAGIHKNLDRATGELKNCFLPEVRQVMSPIQLGEDYFLEPDGDTMYTLKRLDDERLSIPLPVRNVTDARTVAKAIIAALHIARTAADRIGNRRAHAEIGRTMAVLFSPITAAIYEARDKE